MTEKRVLVFGGTIEGRQVSDYLSESCISHTLCVATEYGEEVLSPDAYLQVHQGRLDLEQMAGLMQAGRFCVVIDATHPYAVEVSKNIREACEQAKLPYLRYLRPADGMDENSSCVFVSSAQEAAEYLEKRPGRIFLTTGSKELHIFTETITDKSRLFARVLPLPEIIASCRALGLEGKQLCAMQGPFSAEMNEAMMRQTGAKHLVTKETGSSGGFPEKLEAAARLGVQTVIIRRPQEAGLDWETLKDRIQELTASEPENSVQKPAGAEEADSVQECPDTCRAESARRITCIGIGTGALSTLTYEAADEIRRADIIFGAKRMLESVKAMPGILRDERPAPQGEAEMPGAADCQAAMNAKAEMPGVADCQVGKAKTAHLPVMVEEYSAPKIASYLTKHPQYRRAAVLMSGDVGFYSGARGFQQEFPDGQVYFCCGISSVVYFASKIPTAWQDAKLVSAHGKELAILNYVNRYPKLFLLVSGRGDVERICGELHGAGMDQVRVTVGTNLSYPEEKISRGRAADFLHCDTDGLHIMLLENPAATHMITPGIADECFVRGKVPMTKEEIRILSVAKLHLTDEAVVYDVGAGTGSVAAEIARLCTGGRVYAVERNPEGIALIRENCQKLRLSNVTVVEGSAPEALSGLPAPTHAFIGGSSGNMRSIIELLLAKNPQVRIVINTIALESIAEVTEILEALAMKDADIVQVSAAKSRVLGRYHMMSALNPVYIVSFGEKNRNTL